MMHGDDFEDLSFANDMGKNAHVKSIYGFQEAQLVCPKLHNSFALVFQQRLGGNGAIASLTETCKGYIISLPLDTNVISTFSFDLHLVEFSTNVSTM